MGGAAAIDRLHEAHGSSRATRHACAQIESGEQIVVGVNKLTETEPSPLSGGDGRDHVRRSRDGGRADRSLEGMARKPRRQGASPRARRRSSAAAKEGRKSWSSIECAKPASRPASGHGAAQDVGRVSRADRRCPGAPSPRRAHSWSRSRQRRARLGPLGRRSSSSSASPASTATPTAPS